MIGTTLAHYRITAALGAGGMGEVWRATDEKLGREVALKVLPEDFAKDPDRLARFEREAKVLASLNHPNIAHLYGLETVNTRMAAGTAAPQGSQADGKGLVGHASRVPDADAAREPHAPKGVRATSPSSVIPSETERSPSVIPSERSEPRDPGGGSRHVYSGSHPPDSSAPASPGDASARNDRMGGASPGDASARNDRMGGASQGDGFGRNDNSVVHFVVMESVEGEDLAARLKRGPIPVDDAMPLALQIAEGLEAANDQGITFNWFAELERLAGPGGAR